MSDRLGVAPSEMLYVGDNPQKDFAVKKYLPIKTARVYLNGNYAYADYDGGIKEDIVLGSIAELSGCDFEVDAYGGQTVIRSLLLGIMDFIHSVCDKENITYSLSGGTLIGAVRHKGFVPWDDDIDVVMKREEYEKFVSVVKLQGDEFEVDELSSRVPQVRYTADPIVDGKRYHGVKIDVFILDNFPDSDKERRKIVFKLKTLQGMMRKDKVNWSNYSAKGKVLLMCTKALGACRSLRGLI
ncbi:MAG: LicD family protein, partial [Clostridiales bacterium]|nr:LicD family protein [Clostridiales bacterium]